MLRKTDYPSFGYMLENGATALWERWEKNLGFMTSHDHPMSGGFGVWFFKALGGFGFGMLTEAQPLRIAPAIPAGLGFVHCRRRCPTGELVCDWYRSGKDVHFDIRIPWNQQAELVLPRLGCSLEELTVNGRPATEDAQLRETPSAFCLEVGAGYWHLVLRPGAASEN